MGSDWPQAGGEHTVKETGSEPGGGGGGVAEIPRKGEIGEEQRRREAESHLRDKSASGKKG